MTDTPVNIVTIKWGTLYGPEYANRLYAAVKRNLSKPHQFVCFTDNPEGLDPGIKVFPIPDVPMPDYYLNSGWRKICLFRKDLPISGTSLFMDLDLVITGSLDVFFEFGKLEQIPIIHNWVPWHKTLFRKRPEIGNSSVFRFVANECGFVYEQYLSEQEWALKTFWPPQSYLTHCIRPRMVYWPEEWVRSFKRHCTRIFPMNFFLTPTIPVGTRIIAFHGRPNPDEALMGFKGKKLHHYVRPTKWIGDYWIDDKKP
jgi:hypothetical protein